jgi:GNAT superfamily N-acetyltransferase
LTREEAALLHEELKTTPNILGYTVREIMRFRDVTVSEEDGRLAGVCVCKDLLFGWTDIAVLYVLPTFRGRGLASELYSHAWSRCSARGRHIYTLSRSPAVIHLMERYGMSLSGSMLKAPLAVHIHMQVHMSSLYRISESIRKGFVMKTQSRLIGGVKRYTVAASVVAAPEGKDSRS